MFLSQEVEYEEQVKRDNFIKLSKKEQRELMEQEKEALEHEIQKTDHLLALGM